MSSGRRTRTIAFRTIAIRTTATITALAAAGSLAVTAAPTYAETADRAAPPTTIALPDGFQPEGIATDDRGHAYLGSRLDGDIYRVDLETGIGRTISQGPGTPSLGIKVDDERRLWVAGGSGGDARVVDARSGTVLASYRLAPTGTATFVNDVVLTERAAWFTDSLGTSLSKVPISRRGEAGKLPAQGKVRAKPLTGAWVQTPRANNANGIATTPDEKALLVVNSANGLLYRVARSGRAEVVNLGGYLLTNGDGLLREGRTLYVVQNRLNQVAVLRLTKSGRIGELRRTITAPGFDVPTTVARSGRRLYLPNARFTTPATATTPYAVTGVKG